MMARDVGDPSFLIWLLGDSNPKRWENVLDAPFDPRHPVRHNVWTAVLDVIQERIFLLSGSRLDTSSLYIRNAVADVATKPGETSVEWGPVMEEVAVLRGLVGKYTPVLLLSFGSFSFEFARRALSEECRRAFSYWTTRRLGDEFRQRLGQFDPAKTDLLPLLHVSIARGRFVQSHDYFCALGGANYFDVVGKAIGDVLVRYRDALPIWIRRGQADSVPGHDRLLAQLLQSSHITCPDLADAPRQQGVYVLWLDSSPPTCLKVGMAGPRGGNGLRGRLYLHCRSHPGNTVLARHLAADSTSPWGKEWDFAHVEDRRRFLAERCYFQALALPELSIARLRAFEDFLEQRLEPRYMGRVGGGG